MRAQKRRLLLINGLASPGAIIDQLLSNSGADSNIYLSYPLGVMTLGAWCRQRFPEWDLQIVDAMMELHRHISTPQREPIDQDEFLARLLDEVESPPDYIGISISFSNAHRSCLELCRRAKAKWPNAVIVAGGMHATTFTKRVVAEPAIDYVVRGPGDLAFPELLAHLEEGKSPLGIPGVVTRASLQYSMGARETDLDRVPPYPYDLIDMEYLVTNDSTNPIYEAGQRTGIIFMSRGCPFGCSFCSADKVHGKKVLFKSVSRVLSEIDQLVQVYGVNTIGILDDLFGADRAHFNALFDGIKERGLKFRLTIPGGLSVAVFNEDMIDVLIEHGLRAIYFPLESGSRYIQMNVLKKRVDLEKAARLIAHTKKRGLFTGINIVLGSPGETKAHMRETYEFIKALPVDWIAFFAAFPYPETDMTNILLERGELDEERLMEIWDSATQGFKPRPFDTVEITGKELSELIYDFNIELNFFENHSMRTRDYAGLLPKLDKIVQRYPFHVVAMACRAKCRRELGRTEEALADARAIDELVANNAESRRLFERYGDKIRGFVAAG